MDKYILVQWPESQELMEHERFDECLLVQDDDESNNNSYMCPEDLYEKIFKTSKIESLRINKLQFRPASYLGNTPSFPSWHIDYFYPNSLYGREGEFEKAGDFYVKKTPYSIKFHKSCFTNKESCFSIAAFNRDKDGYYELSFIEDRPLNLDKADFNDFMLLVKYGYRELNKLYKEDA